jgi:hypothetical protein
MIRTALDQFHDIFLADQIEKENSKVKYCVKSVTKVKKVKIESVFVQTLQIIFSKT